MRLRKITVISGITLRAHFSLGIAKFDTLPNHYKFLVIDCAINIKSIQFGFVIHASIAIVFLIN